MTKLEVYFDGSCGPTNPGGTAAYGYVVYDDDRNVIHEGYGRVVSGPAASNNVAEYAGLYEAMKYIARAHDGTPAVFKGDSSLVISQMTGESQARKGLYLPYYRLAKAFGKPYIESGLWTFAWIPRDMNSEADELSQYSRYPNEERN